MSDDKKNPKEPVEQTESMAESNQASPSTTSAQQSASPQDQSQPGKQPTQSPNNDLNSKITELETRISETENKLKTALADYQNMLKEVEKQRAFVTDMIKKEVFSDLIELFTDLYMGLEQFPVDMKENPHVQGISIIINKYRDLLKKHNVTELSFNEGDPYDPSKAEVVCIIPDAQKDGVVSATVQPGYAVNGVLIKAARVTIFKKNSA